MKIRSKGAAVLAACAVTLGAMLAVPAGAEHFDILLRINSGEKQAEAPADTTPPIGGVNPRPVLSIKAGDTIKVTWNLKNNSPHGALKNVGVHFFVVREGNIGQKPVPNPAGEAGVFDSSFTTDMSVGAVSTGGLKLKLTDPGSYLVRLQSENTHDEAGHEHFAAIDIEVK